MINYGKLLVYDTVDKLAKMANMNQIEVVLADAPSKESLERIARFKDVAKIQQPAQLRLYIEFTGDPNIRYLLLKEMLAADMKVLTFNPRGLALENLYMQLVGDSR
jgi:TusA-related sulfurtransferase